MSFKPIPGFELKFGKRIFQIVEHPNTPGIPHSQEGSQAVVYQLRSTDDLRALKVFDSRYRLPSLVVLSQQIEKYAHMPGLRVCRRDVLTPQNNLELLQDNPELTYAVLMPWIEGPTWLEILIEAEALPQKRSLTIARSFASILGLQWLFFLL